MKSLKTLIRVFLGASVLTAALTAAAAEASVTFSDKAVSDSSVITIAGNPSFYPYESYNSSTKEYEGAFVKIFERISEETGLDFVYVCGSSSDDRLYLAKKGDAGIVSGFSYNESQMERYGLTDFTAAVETDDDGADQKVGIAFTDQLKPEQIEAVSKAFTAACSEYLVSEIALSANREPAGTTSGIFIVICLAALLLCAAAAVLLLYRNRKLKNQMIKNENLDLQTGLLNRNGFRKSFTSLADKSYRAVYFLTYFGFNVSYVNDNYGADEADEQILFGARVLKDNSSETDLLGRYPGGCLLCLRICSTEQEMEEWVHNKLESLNQFCTDRNMEGRAFYHAGIYRMKNEGWDVDKAYSIVRRAYEKGGKDKKPYLFSEESKIQSDTIRDILSKDVSSALESEGFKLYLQPVVKANSHEIAGAEALSRWQHPDMGLLQPGRYIDMMTQRGNVAELDFYLLDLVCRTLERWETAGYGFWLSTNLSRQTIIHDEFTERFEKIVSHYHFDRTRLILEITEDCLTPDKELAYKNLKFCTDQGFRLSLDDMGSGYTFFSDLIDYPLGVAKMDRKLLLAAATERGHALYMGLVAACKGLGMTVVGEGVETQAQCDICTEAGVDFIQGFYYYTPISIEEFERMHITGYRS